MPRYARHLAEHDIVNPFPGMVQLERRLGHPVPVRIGSNEGLAEPASPLVAAFGPALADLARLYPDPYALALREQLAALTGCQPEQVVIDAGADSLILLALRLCVNPGDPVVTTAGSYPTFRYFAEGVGARTEHGLGTAADGTGRKPWRAMTPICRSCGASPRLWAICGSKSCSWAVRWRAGHRLRPACLSAPPCRHSSALPCPPPPAPPPDRG